MECHDRDEFNEKLAANNWQSIELKDISHCEYGNNIDINLPQEPELNLKTDVTQGTAHDNALRNLYTHFSARYIILDDTHGEILKLPWMLDNFQLTSYVEFPINRQVDKQTENVVDSVDLEAAIRILRKENI